MSEEFAIRFGLGAIKALGLGAVDEICKERDENGEFKNIFDFAARLNPKLINKKTIEALAKSGTIDKITNNRNQIFKSYDIISQYSIQKFETKNSDQLSLFDSVPEIDKKPELKFTEDWNKKEKLQKEFEAFGFFLNDHPIDDYLDEIKKRGCVNSYRIEEDDIEDGSIIKIAGVVANSKHRSGSKGRFAYLSMSDNIGIFEVMIFDEAIINKCRDIINDGNLVVIECLIKKDGGGTRILAKNIFEIDNFIANNEAKKEFFEDITKQTKRKFNDKTQNISNFKNLEEKKELSKELKVDDIEPLKEIEIIINSSNAISSIKFFLSKKITFDDSIKYTRVLLLAKNKDSFNKILLKNKYFISENELTELSFNKDIKINKF